MPAMMLQRTCIRRILIVPTLQRGNDVLTLQRHPDGIAPSPGGVLFFACPKKRTKRKGSPAAETTPADGLRNRRGKNSLRSNSLPLFSGPAPRRPAQRQRAVFLPRKSFIPQSVLLAGPALRLVAGHSEGDRSHAPAWERYLDAPALSGWHRHPCREAFFSLPAQRKEPKERAALPLRRPRSRTPPPGSAPKGCFSSPEKPSCPEPSSWRGQRSASWRGILRAIVPTLQRGNGLLTLPRHRFKKSRNPKTPSPATDQSRTIAPFVALPNK